MTGFTVGDKVCRKDGSDPGTVIAVIIATAMNRPDRVRVMSEKGVIYEAEARLLQKRS